MTAERTAHLLELFARRVFDPRGGDENRRRGSRWQREMLARPLTPDVAEALLAALA